MNQKEAERLSELWTVAQPTVAAFIRAVIRDRDDAQDVLQQVAVQLVRSYGNYDSGRPFVSWAIEVLVWRRKAANDRVMFASELVESFAAAFSESGHAQGGYFDALDHCIEAIPDRNRETLKLFYGQDLGADEVAVQMNRTVGAIRTMLCRTREMIRECIERRIAIEGAANDS